MKRSFLVLILFAGLGSSISFAQARHAFPIADPFDRYIKETSSNLSEPAVDRFAHECGVDVSNSQPRFAINPGSKWMTAANLSKSIRSVESDFFSSAEVWHEGDRAVVEIWAVSADVGSEVRVYRCFTKGELLRVEAIDWNIPLVKTDVGAWGYLRRWERDAGAGMRRTKAEFVDGFERPIARPKLDAEGEQSLIWEPELGPLADLKLPPTLSH